MKNHPPKENIFTLLEEEPGSASNESIDEDEEEGPTCLNHLDGKDEEEIQIFQPLEEDHIVKDPLFEVFFSHTIWVDH